VLGCGTKFCSSPKPQRANWHGRGTSGGAVAGGALRAETTRAPDRARPRAQKRDFELIATHQYAPKRTAVLAAGTRLVPKPQRADWHGRGTSGGAVAGGTLRVETTRVPDRARPRAQKRDFGSGSRQFVCSATIGRLSIPVTIRSGRHARTSLRPGRPRSANHPRCICTRKIFVPHPIARRPANWKRIPRKIRALNP